MKLPHVDLKSVEAMLAVNAEKAKDIRDTEVLMIDEISMLSAKFFDDVNFISQIAKVRAC